MVAKTYQKYKIVGEPYTVGGRMYVKIDRDGKEQQVRWYSDAEYDRMYPGERAANDHSKDPFWKSQKEVLGFKEGFIWIFTGNTFEHKDWFKENGATYRKWWGWSFPGKEDLGLELPDGVEAVKLMWDTVKKDDENLLPEDQVVAVVETLTYEPSVSEFVGEIGDKLDLEVSLVKKVNFEGGYYGPTTMYVFEDSCENVFVWTTSVNKDWEAGQMIHLLGTVKDHKIYKNVKQTVLTRCREGA